MQMQQTPRPLHPTQRRRLGHLVNHTRAAAADVEAAEAKVIRPRDSGWVAPAKPMESIGTPGIDFNRSFVTFTIDQSVKPAATMSDAPPFDLNNARIPIDCVLTITERSSGRAEVFHLGGNCKTETVGVPRDHGIWMAPNADFVPIFTARQALILKSYDRIGRAVQFSAASGTRAGTVQTDRQLVDVAEAYSNLDLGLNRGAARWLSSAREVVGWGLANQPLSARTQFCSQRYDCVLEYPIKTVNLNNRDWFFQPDTGPVLFPDLALPFDELLGGMELAFIAWNAYSGSATGDQTTSPAAAGWAEFLVRRPTTVCTDAQSGLPLQTYHYSQAVKMECHNSVWV